MIDLKDLEAKSDQMNAVDFVTPMLFRIKKVDYNPRQEQPIKLHLEGYDGRPYKPCKSMLRGLTQAWGMDEQAWTGRMIELYCDPSVTWAGKSTGGIRISAVSAIDEPFKFTVQLNKTQRKIETWGVIAEEKAVAKEFVITHWEADIAEAKSNEAIDVIVQTVNNEFGGDALSKLKDTVLAARAKLVEVEVTGDES